MNKKIGKNFGQTFKERLICQLCHDLEINDRQELELKEKMEFTGFFKTNNDREINGTINHHIDVIKFSAFEAGGIEHIDELELTEQLNNYLLRTKIEANESAQGPYITPREVMNQLMDEL